MGALWASVGRISATGRSKMLLCVSKSTSSNSKTNTKAVVKALKLKTQLVTKHKVNVASRICFETKVATTQARKSRIIVKTNIQNKEEVTTRLLKIGLVNSKWETILRNYRTTSSFSHRHPEKVLRTCITIRIKCNSISNKETSELQQVDQGKEA